MTLQIIIRHPFFLLYYLWSLIVQSSSELLSALSLYSNGKSLSHSLPLIFSLGALETFRVSSRTIINLSIFRNVMTTTMTTTTIFEIHLVQATDQKTDERTDSLSLSLSSFHLSEPSKQQLYHVYIHHISNDDDDDDLFTSMHWFLISASSKDVPSFALFCSLWFSILLLIFFISLFLLFRHTYLL